jgi:hypothetical protein
MSIYEPEDDESRARLDDEPEAVGAHGPVTILQLALYRLGLPADHPGSLDGAQFEGVGLPIMGGCERCHASIAAYNAHPSLTGFLQCSDCIADLGYATVEEANRAIFPGEYVWVGKSGRALFDAAPALRDACVRADLELARIDNDRHALARGQVRAALAVAGLRPDGTPFPVCSICRLRHGLEKVHECE